MAPIFGTKQRSTSFQPPKRASEVVQSLLPRMEDARGKLEIAWSLAVGARLARRTRIVSLQGEELLVSTPDRTWQGALEGMSRRILDSLRASLGDEAPRRLLVNVVSEIGRGSSVSMVNGPKKTPAPGWSHGPVARTRVESPVSRDTSEPASPNEPTLELVSSLVLDPSLRVAILRALAAHDRRYPRSTGSPEGIGE